MVYKQVRLNGDSLRLREFKLDWFAPSPSIAMIAKRRSGKSWVCREILKHFSDIPGGLIIAPTDKMSCFYGKFFPDLYIHYKFDPEILKKMLKRQDIMIEKMKIKERQGKRVDPRAYLIMDDCLSSKGSWMKDEMIMEMFFNGRHYHIMYILTMQFPLGISPELRGNFDYVFLLAEDVVSNQKRLYDHYAGIFPNFNAFKSVFAEVTRDHGSMVLVNQGAAANFLDKVFWFKAHDTRIDKMGCKQFRKFHDVNYNPNWKKQKKSKTIDELFDKKHIDKVYIDKIKS
jgi:hypothetical protein